MEHPVLSSSGPAVLCRIEGGLQPARSAICCGDYYKCGIWRVHREITVNAKASKKIRDETLTEPRPHG